ncbi:Nucleoside-diphosphatase [Acanthamoeba castellanii str. Neff]|uniref:Nucleoside-diphosphatase n=1 Tax=Acanthamoeba castellanii (strain ATCC 30010 / Neff) TaxID=1257118 RepID=L8GJW6_ACACF|nr:Nucleoside-diphosphatase [Acanthamoeba castellanii str. Neff]ELR12481.1 Nucleoside-diphosphatase [Acanthamoeba castellanii str. Neff]
MGPFSQLHSRHKQVVVGLVVVFLFVGALLYFNPAVLTDGTGASPHSRGLKDSPLEAHLRYPLQQAYHKYKPSSTHYSITIVADMDKASKTDDKKWRSTLKSGTLTRNPRDQEMDVTSVFNDGSRGMELSELAYFNEQLLTFDDRTGIVYFVEGEKVIPKHILMDGNGHIDKALSQDPPVHYVRFALMAKRSVEFWGGRKEQQLTQRREEEIKLRKRKDVLATRTTEAGGDLEELRMLEATIDAGYKVAMPPSLKAALAHKLGGKDQFHFRNITEDELLELLVTPRSTKTEQNEEDEGENDVIVVGDEDEDEEAENGEEEEDTNAAEADGGDGEESAPIFVIDTKGAPTPKHTAKPAATADKEKAAAPSSLQRDVAALLEQLSEEEEE